MLGKIGFPSLVMLLVLTGTVLPLGHADAQEKPLAKLPAILEELRQGGLVIYFRHAVTVEAGTNYAPEDLQRCETQRQLSARGQADSLQIGKSIKALGIPIDMVLSSPYCRAKDTARLAFGRFTENPDLGFVMGTDADQTRRMAESLRRMLATSPKKGSNNVIVSHSANLLEAAGIFAKPEGAAYIFRPLADGRFEAVAKLLPDEWSEAKQ